MTDNAWRPSGAAWLVHDPSRVMVTVRPLGPWDASAALADDPAALVGVLVELLAHDLDDAAIGAFVRMVLDDARLARIGVNVWSKRVAEVVPVEDSFLGGGL